MPRQSIEIIYPVSPSYPFAHSHTQLTHKRLYVDPDAIERVSTDLLLTH